MELLGVKGRFLLGFISVSLLLPGACNDQPSNTSTKANYSKPPSSYHDTLRISGRSAVFYGPDSLQSIQLKRVLGDRVYESNSHECIYMLLNTRNVINRYWPGLPIIVTRSARWLHFEKWKNSSFVDLDRQDETCGLFLFDPGKEPRLVDMMNIETALDDYFRDK